MIETLSNFLRKSSAIFDCLGKSSVIIGTIREKFGNFQVAQFLENFQKSPSKDARKSLEGRYHEVFL